MNTLRFFFRVGLCVLAVFAMHSFAYAQNEEFRCEVDPHIIPENVPMENVTLTVVVLLVQFSDWATNEDARGSVRYIDTNSDGIPDTRVYDGYKYEHYWNKVFSEWTYLGDANPDYYHFYNYPRDIRLGQHLEVFGSLRDYWEEVSYANLVIVPGETRPGESGIVNSVDWQSDPGTVEWITLDHPKAYYNGSSLGDDAIAKARQLYSTGLLDVNVDHYDRVFIMWAGGFDPLEHCTIGWIGDGRYWFNSPERYFRPQFPSEYGRFLGINVGAHEFGHTIGFPDLHDYFQTYGVGHYCVMGPIRPLNEFSPTHVNPRLRLEKGWLGCILVNNPNYEPLANQYLPPVEQPYQRGNPFVAVIPVRGNPGGGGNWQQGEYFIVENRRVLSFDRGLAWFSEFPGGFLVWHYTDAACSFPGFQTYDNQRFRIEEADGKFNLAKPVSDPEANSGTTDDFWPGTIGVQVFSPWSSPSSRQCNGTLTDVGLEVTSYNVATGAFNVDLYYRNI